MMSKKLPAGWAVRAQKSMKKPQWRATALAIATAVLLATSASDASALGLGRVTVQSALGEPLRADIDIPEITAEEVSSLRAAIASPEVFRAAGFEYNAAMANVQITLQRRPDGRYFLHLSSQRPVNEPFIDLILEASWSSGRIVRDYTMLFDPPNLRQSAPPVAAEVAPAARPPQTLPAAAPQASRPPSLSTAPTAGTRAPRQSAAAAKPATSDGKQVTVKSGDTAGRIAAANKPTTVSLDQMLVALLRGNPEAFIGGNINRLKAGAVLEVPTAEQAEQVSAGEASRSIIAQSRDFNEFRRRLAEGLPATAVGASERQASGRVQAQVEEKKPVPATSDKLTLSKGAIQDKGAADKIARDRAAKDDATRVAELSKNLSDLNKLGIATAPPSAGAASSAKAGVPLPVAVASAVKAASAPAAVAPIASASSAKSAASAPAAASTVKPSASAPVAAPPVAFASVAKASAPAAASPVASASAAKPASAPAVDAISAPASAPAAVAVPAPAASAATGVTPAATAPAASAAATPTASPASATVAAAPAVPAASARRAPSPPPVETSLVDDLLENPIVPATVAGVLALLLGFGFYRAQQRKKSTQVDSSFLESRLQPDSFFGASGGQRIDTNEGNATGSSMVYSPSQLDAAGDVDPVAEADVYLAYGRDLQAEEILKEAMRTTPQRVAVHSKLLEIYAKRRDAKAFELIATEAYSLTRGEGAEWEHISELGQGLDPGNSLYRPGGHPAQTAGGARADDSASVATQVMPTAVSPANAVDLDLDLDFSIGDDEPTPPVTAPTAPLPNVEMDMPPVAEPMPTLDMDFGSAATAQPTATPQSASRRPEPAGVNARDLEVADNSLRFDATQTMKPAAPKAATAPAADAGMIEFDLGALSLDLDSPPAAATRSTSAAGKPQADDALDSTAGAPLSTAGLEADDSSDPLATKLALAQEFNAIGDPDGARSLAEEVLAEASGDLKQKAQRFLAEIA
jgi:pilus assembly protein FimV